MKFELIRSFIQACDKRGIPDPQAFRHPMHTTWAITTVPTDEIVIIWKPDDIEMIHRYEEALTKELPWVWLGGALQDEGSVISKFKIVEKPNATI